MIVSASRRCDVPACRADWFFERLAAGEVLVANPFNAKQLRRVALNAAEVDGFVFWTKNPAPMLGRLPLLNPYPWYFQCTITGAPQPVEPGLPNKETVVLPAVLQLAERYGHQRVVWRFDPLVFGGECTPAWHAGRFDALARRLAGRVAKCVISFYSPYAGARRRMQKAGYRPPTAQEKLQTARLLGQAAQSHGLAIESCAEAEDLSALGIGRGRCISAERLAAIAGRPLAAAKDKHQRPHCGCDASVDIGSYGPCPIGCLYCYARR